ncbi:MAG TPA: sensor histidine kinase [Falsiroseomonas sp.]|jgi:two-component sensor histidine kinase|nr:sensor histidine kinase [Falsiroseomonas sp.]
MPDQPSLAHLLQRTRRLSTALRYAITTVIVVVLFAVPESLVSGIPSSYSLTHLLIAVLLAAALFDHGTGLFATLLGAALGYWRNLGPAPSLGAQDPDMLVELAMFVVVGATISLVMEALHLAVARQQQAQDDLRRSERAQSLLLHEFRHRTRNDLGSLVSLLMLRARLAPSPAAQEALRDAADHALALARVHARLALDDGLDQGAERPVVDSRDFITGLCSDIATSLTSAGLRPVRLLAEAEPHPLSAERAVPLGLVLNEAVTNSLKYAFPEDRPGTVQVRFTRDGAEFVLVVTDDGIGVPPEGELEGAPPAFPSRDAGLGTRLLRSLAAQLRGRFTRRPGPDGAGTVVELRFLATEPGGDRAASAA